MKIDKINNLVNNSSVLVHWSAPNESNYTWYVFRYRAESESKWTKVLFLKATEANVTGIMAGERYKIQVNTIKDGMESLRSEQVTKAYRPCAVSNISALADSTNITLKYPRPEGRVEVYALSWWPSERPDMDRTKNVYESNICKYVQYRKFSNFITSTA